LLCSERLEIAVFPHEVRFVAWAVVIAYLGLTDASVVLVGLPHIAHIAVFQHHGQLAAGCIQRHVKLLKVCFAHLRGTGQQQLIPKERLKGIEIQAVVLEKAQLVVVTFDILLVHPVDDQYIVGGKFYPSDLASQYRDKQLKTDNLVSSHAQGTRHGDALVTHFSIE